MGTRHECPWTTAPKKTDIPHEHCVLMLECFARFCGQTGRPWHIEISSNDKLRFPKKSVSLKILPDRIWLEKPTKISNFANVSLRIFHMSQNPEDQRKGHLKIDCFYLDASSCLHDFRFGFRGLLALVSIDSLVYWFIDNLVLLSEFDWARLYSVFLLIAWSK